MAKKPVDHDATMDLSMSQLVVDAPPKPAERSDALRTLIPPASEGRPVLGSSPTAPAPRPAAGDRNDVSLWAYRVVGSDDFAPVPAAPRPRVRAWLVAILLAVTLGAGGVLVYRYLL